MYLHELLAFAVSEMCLVIQVALGTGRLNNLLMARSCSGVMAPHSRPTEVICTSTAAISDILKDVKCLCLCVCCVCVCQKAVSKIF